MSDEVRAQLEFERIVGDELLDEPLRNEDADELGNQLMDLQHTLRCLFTRARRQYGGVDSWISNEFWAAFQQSEQLWDRLQRLYDADGFKGPGSR